MIRCSDVLAACVDTADSVYTNNNLAGPNTVIVQYGASNTMLGRSQARTCLMMRSCLNAPGGDWPSAASVKQLGLWSHSDD